VFSPYLALRFDLQAFLPDKSVIYPRLTHLRRTGIGGPASGQAIQIAAYKEPVEFS